MMVHRAPESTISFGQSNPLAAMPMDRLRGLAFDLYRFWGTLDESDPIYPVTSKSPNTNDSSVPS